MPLRLKLRYRGRLLVYRSILLVQASRRLVRAAVLKVDDSGRLSMQTPGSHREIHWLAGGLMPCAMEAVQLAVWPSVFNLKLSVSIG